MKMSFHAERENFMKRILSVILSVFLLAGAAGCQRTSGEPSDRNDTREDVYLTRTNSKTVYGVEVPSALDERLPGELVQLSASADAAQQTPDNQPDEMRGVWLSYLNLDAMIKGQNEAQFTANIDAAFQKIADFGFNTVFAQVRPFGDAYYDSAYFPWSARITGTEGKNPGYDPLAVMCAAADKYDLRIEAWLNPYRVRVSATPEMASSNQAKKWLNAGNDAALSWNGGVYYNPGSADARKLIVNGVKEIVKNYDVDGIHFDDYFYPTSDLSFDRASYQKSGSKLGHADWRRENVNTLVREVYAAVKELDPDCIFGISPQGNTKINYESQFADVGKWLANPGYVDYILPQVYYGYQNDTCPYEETVAKWNGMIKTDGVRLYVGLAGYKVGVVDEWAGAGKNEWIGTTDLLARMVKTARQNSHYGGIAVYSYDSLFGQGGAQIEAECQNLQNLF